MEKYITSRDNKIVKELVSLKKRIGRQKHSLYVVEGKRICDEAVKWAKDDILYFVYSDSFYKENKIISENTVSYILPDELFCKVTDTETPQGILCVMKLKKTYSAFPKSDNILILDGVSEPGNMGTILRTAEAMGFFDVYITKGSADIYNSKVIRSTMGAVFRLNFHFEATLNFIDSLKTMGYKVITTALKNSTPLRETPVHQKNAVVIGNEAVGVSDEIIEKSDIITKIEMCGNAESLNAAIAAGIVMYNFSLKKR